ncbi:LOW QUALITY PROTEIN: hypothetical protein YC2023_095371 [Brassica napus]
MGERVTWCSTCSCAQIDPDVTYEERQHSLCKINHSAHGHLVSLTYYPSCDTEHANVKISLGYFLERRTNRINLNIECNGTNLKFKCLEKHNVRLTGRVNFYITLEATDPATGSVCSFQTLFSDFGSCLSLGARITWVTLALRFLNTQRTNCFLTSDNQPIDDVWDEDTPGINEFYKVPMPKWFSDEALEKYYVVPESELHDNDWLQLLMEVAFFSKADRCLDAYLPLELKNVVVETFEDYTTEPSEKLKADNAISTSCCSDPFLRLGGPHFLTGDHCARVRKIMDGKPGHMSLAVALTREQENK